MKNNLKLAAVGDICPGDKVILGAGVGKQSLKKGFECFFDNTREILKNAGIVLGNLEGVLSKTIENIKKKIFCGTPEIAASLKNNNFMLLSVANNHIFEYSKKLFDETILILRENNLLICSLRGRSEFHSEPVIVELSGMEIGFLA